MWKIKGAAVSPESQLFIMEYITRMRLKSLGFTDDLASLDCITAEALLVIDGAVEEMKAEEMKKSSRKGG